MDNAIKAEEYFYGVSLDKKGASVTWDSKHVDENAYYADRLHIRQILLGHTAKAGEYNVVEVETMSLLEPIKIPIAVLKVGETRLVQPNLEFPDGPVTFTLIEGSGPVYIHGQHLPGNLGDDGLVEEGSDEFASDEECFDDDEDVVEEGNPRKKQKLSTNNSKNATANNKTHPNANKKK